MRKLCVLVLISILLLVGCTNRQIVKNLKVDEMELGERYGFTMLQVSFDTAAIKEAVVSRYDEKTEQIEATYKNQVDQVFLEGDQAMEKLDSIFEEMEIDAKMDDEDLIKEVAKAFQMAEYKVLKLKVKFKGYETKELMLTK